MLGYERVWLGRDLDDLVPFLSILTDQSNRDQLAAKAVQFGIQEDTQGITRVRLPTHPSVSRPEQVVGQPQTGGPGLQYRSGDLASRNTPVAGVNRSRTRAGSRSGIGAPTGGWVEVSAWLG